MRLGILSNAEISLQQNRINYRVLDLLDSVQVAGSQPDGTLDASLSGQVKILMLTANPANTTQLNLDKEHSGILQKLQQKQTYSNIIRRKAVSGSEFKEFTQQEQPGILHFSGHGTGGQYAVIVLQNDDKNEQAVIPVKG